MIQEDEPLENIELPRCVQLEPVGRRAMAQRHSPVSIRVDGMRNAPPAFLSFDAFCRLIKQFPGLEELRLQVPLDAAGAREYDFSRRGARHERMLRHLRFLAEGRKAGRSLWPHLGFTAVVMRRNLSSLAEVVRLAHEHGVEQVSVLSLEQFVDASAHGVYIGFSGEAKPCGMAARQDGISFGNMLKEGVAPVWRGEAYGKFRERHLSADPPELCRSCPAGGGK